MKAATKFYEAVKWVYQNLDMVVYWLKIYLKTLAILKISSMAISLVTNGMRMAMFLWRIGVWLTRRAIIALNLIYNLVFLVAKTLLDAILYPMQQIMELVAQFTGAEWVKNAAGTIKAFHTDRGVEVEGGGIKDSLHNAANPRESDRQASMAERLEGRGLNDVGLEINTRPSVTAKVTSNKGDIPIRTKSTHAFGQ